MGKELLSGNGRWRREWNFLAIVLDTTVASSTGTNSGVASIHHLHVSATSNYQVMLQGLQTNVIIPE
jgi:hypothetical protein